jgi:alpha-beta hydrolase superfamily lysophospholipase
MSFPSPTRTESFLDSADGTKIHVVRHGAGDRDVLIVHGLAEHAARYDHVAAAFCARQATVHVMELRGHGRSGGRRSHVLAWGEYVADVRAVAATLRPGWVQLAHSMGGLVSLDAVRDGLRPARLALSNPLLGVRMKVPAVKAFAGRALSRVWPTLALLNELDPAGLSRDQAVGEAYAKDPDVYKKVTTRWFTEMTGAQARVLATSGLGVPLGLFLGDADPITDTHAAERFVAAQGGFVRHYADMRHEIVNELDKEQVIADIGDWLLG